MRLWFDTEFIEDGPDRPLELISIGVVAEDGREFYAESADVKLHRANPWVKANVIPHLRNGLTKRTRTQIAADLLDFVGNEPPEWWGYYCDYDWVILCQLFGAMIDLPARWPMYALDVKQLAFSRGDPKLPPPFPGDGPEHNALADARWTRQAFTYLLSFGEVYTYPTALNVSIAP